MPSLIQSYIMKQHEKFPCALLTNDWHVGKDSIPDFIKNWEEAIHICKEHNIDQLIVGGDLFQSRVGQTLAVLIAVYRALEIADASGIEVTLAEGNHDLVDQESLVGYCHIFGKHPHVYVVDDYVSIKFPEGPSIHVMSYFPENGSFIERLQLLSDTLHTDDYNILYCHEGIRGGMAKPSDKEVPAEIFKAFDKVLVGHYHDRNVISGTNIEYIGASRQHNFGEDMAKGYTVVYSDGSTEFIQNQVNTRYRTVEVESLEQAKNVLAEGVDEKTKIKLRLTCGSDVAATINKDALLELGASKVEVVTEASASCSKSADFDVKYDKAGLKEEYTHFCKQKEIDNVQFGLDYLEKIG